MSVAIAERVCVPFALAVVSHDAWYGAARSVAESADTPPGPKTTNGSRLDIPEVVNDEIA